jgi:hypothetical protein
MRSFPELLTLIKGEGGRFCHLNCIDRLKPTKKPNVHFVKKLIILASLAINRVLTVTV